jgi:RNA polymerase sigma-54 factor
MLAEIRALDPRPGLAFEDLGAEAIVYDVEMREAADGSWHIELNPDALPRIDRQPRLLHVFREAGLSTEEKLFMSECLQSATWLERSLVTAGQHDSQGRDRDRHASRTRFFSTVSAR